MSIKIKSVKLIDKGEKLEIGVQSSDKISSLDTRIGQDHVHPDMNKTMDKLIPHLVILADFADEASIKEKDLKGWVMNGFSIGGNDANETITLKGGYTTIRGAYFSVNITRPTKQTENTTYSLLAKMLSVVDEVIAETHAYIDDGKKLQGDLYNESGKEKVTKAQIANPETKVFKNGTEADPEAQQRVNDWDHTKTATSVADVAAAIVKETNKGKSKKKVAQTAESKNGEIEE